MMEITPEHPVYVEGKGWVWAENLAIGDRLRRADGGWAKVLTVERVKLAEPELVYNFTVKGLHTYFVLEVGVLVHNVQCKFNPGTNRYHATEDLKLNGKQYRKGQIVPKPGRVIDVSEASRLSGIPEQYLEQVPEIAQRYKTICGFRDCNPNLNKLRTKTWPKDTDAPLYHPVTGEKLKVSSATDPRFKSNKYGLVQARLKVGDEEIDYGIVRRPTEFSFLPDGSFVETKPKFDLIPMDEIIDNEGNIILQLGEGIPMGPDVDTYFFLQKTDSGYVNLGTNTRRSAQFPFGGEIDIRRSLAEEMSDYRPNIPVPVSAIGHGPAQPYFGYVTTDTPPPNHPKSWGPALVVTDDGKFIWLQDHEIESFFNFHGLTTNQKGPDAGYFVTNFLNY